MSAIPSALIVAGHGLNCESETLRAFELAGAKGRMVHLDDLADAPEQLRCHQILALPGGFSYGDHLGAGQALASRLRQDLGEAIADFMAGDRLAIGLCNGCQALVKSGLWNGGGSEGISLAPNAGGSYLCKWVRLEAVSASPWLDGIKSLELPIAHREGRFVGTGLPIALRYLGGNPNGSVDGAAGVTGYGGRLLAMMPHPERAVRFTQRPNWTAERERLRRKGGVVPEHADGLRIFANAVRAFA